MNQVDELTALCKLMRLYILESTTAARSGHPTSSLSAVELMTGLMFGGMFKYRVEDPRYENNDRLIFSKGHAAPLFYALWAAAGGVEESELLKLRQFDSALEGHPSRRFEYTDVATGSLGQGLSVGVGMALAAKMDHLTYRTYVLLGDSEMAEGQIWEAMQLATYYQLNNLVGIIDVNRLGQRGETMLSWDIQQYSKRVEAFGWNAVMLEDGHHLPSVVKAYQIAATAKKKPTMIIAKTTKGKGVSFLEDQEGWHGKALDEGQLKAALEEIGLKKKPEVGKVMKPENMKKQEPTTLKPELAVDVKEDYQKPLAPRNAYGHALVRVGKQHPEVVVLDAEVSNSTYAKTFQTVFPQRFLEMFIAEQNMVSVAVGLAACGKLPYVSSFAAFLTRALDQIRLAAYSQRKLMIVGSHVGVSIGEDGPSQMGLEDISLFRSIFNSVVLAGADHVATEKLVEAMVPYQGISYLRTTRMETEPLYRPEEEFVIGGSKVLIESEKDQVTLLGTGITVYACLEASKRLAAEGIQSRVIDLYSIKPIDVETLVRACKETKALMVVEDHYPEGGLAEAVRSALIYETTPIHSLAVRKLPRSGTPKELMAYEEIDAEALVSKVKAVL